MSNQIENLSERKEIGNFTRLFWIREKLSRAQLLPAWVAPDKVDLKLGAKADIMQV